MPLVGPKPYAPVKCFWVEAGASWIAKVRFEGDEDWTDLGRFETEATGWDATRRAQEGREWETATVSPCYRLPDGRDVTSSELPPGAMFDAKWMHEFIPMTDGITLMVVLPNGVHWSPDSRAGNCGSPDDKDHCCWVRRGDPRTGMIHVDKGHTSRGELSCTAGAGSIASLPQEDDHHYHGHLHLGWLTAG
jgi:hypothetical protein